jgi:hypothetical protein
VQHYTNNDSCHCEYVKFVHQILASALTGIPNLYLKSFLPFNSHIDVNDLQHNKTLKLTKTLEINNANSLINISYGGSNIQYLALIKLVQAFHEGLNDMNKGVVDSGCGGV